MRDEVYVTLNLFPEVMWDRYIETHTGHIFYGWIKREDSHEDFMIVRFDAYGSPTEILTSSKKYSSDFASRLGWREGHSDCDRVEDLEGSETLNCIKLNREVKT